MLPQGFKLPPTEFSNAMNLIYKDWDCTGWETSKEWRLFNAGIAAGSQLTAIYAGEFAEKARKIVRQ